MPVTAFVLGPQRTALAPGEILRCIDLPASALRRRTAFRRIALSPEGRSGALVIGTLDRAGAFALTVTASTPRPVQLHFDAAPTRDALRSAIAAAIPEDGWYDDVHGAPDWRRHVTGLLAEEIREELAR
jgi:CO/xanthine dehydrogenase FAD-binding subunit